MKKTIIIGIFLVILLFLFCSKNKGTDPTPSSVDEKYLNVTVDIIKELR
jgi:hypothetical protein